jgi:hypothetical protein
MDRSTLERGALQAAREFGLNTKEAHDLFQDAVSRWQTDEQLASGEAGESDSIVEHDPGAFRRRALQSFGFPPECWLPVEVARQWQGLNYPLEPSTESIHQWLAFLEQISTVPDALGLGGVSGSTMGEGISDVRLLHRHLSRLAVESQPEAKSNLQTAMPPLVAFLNRHAAGASVPEAEDVLHHLPDHLFPLSAAGRGEGRSQDASEEHSLVRESVGDEQRSSPAAEDLSPGSRACALMLEHPDWTVDEIARAVGVSRATLYRNPRFNAARAACRGRKEDLPRGRRQRQEDGTLELEAWDEEGQNERLR